MTPSPQPLTRRDLLTYAGATVGSTGFAALLGYHQDRRYEDRDEDGIPDELERSDRLHQYMTDLFGDDFDGLDPSRPDLLVDVRYVGEASVTSGTKRALETLFRDRGIYMQWLDYPYRYEEAWFKDRYGYQVERILWPHMSFYEEQVEERLKNIAVQLIVLPHNADADGLESLYALHRGSDFAGVSLGNRCLMIAKDTPEGEARLALHEIAHLGLCHDYGDENRGVMGYQTEKTDLTDDEWRSLRNRLSNVRDSTGFDIALRECLGEEIAHDLSVRMDDRDIPLLTCAAP